MKNAKEFGVERQKRREHSRGLQGGQKCCKKVQKEKHRGKKKTRSKRPTKKGGKT